MLRYLFNNEWISVYTLILNAFLFRWCSGANPDLLLLSCSQQCLGNYTTPEMDHGSPPMESSVVPAKSSQPTLHYNIIFLLCASLYESMSMPTISG